MTGERVRRWSQPIESSHFRKGNSLYLLDFQAENVDRHKTEKIMLVFLAS